MSEQVTDEWAGEVQYRTRHRDLSLCLKELTVHHDDGTYEVWVTCGNEELDRIKLSQGVGDQSDFIRVFVERTKARHEHNVACDIISALIDERAEMQQEIRMLRSTLGENTQ